MNPMMKGILGLRRFLGLATIILLPLVSYSGHCDTAMAQQGESTSIFVLRHAERGNEPDPALTDGGVKRAEGLRHALAWAGVSKIFVTPTKRSLQTASPLAGCLCPELDPRKCCETYPYTNNTDADAGELIRKIFPAYRGKVVVVVAHSDTVQGIVKALTGTPLNDFDAAYDNLFLLSVDEPGQGRILHLKYGLPATLKQCK